MLFALHGLDDNRGGLDGGRGCGVLHALQSGLAKGPAHDELPGHSCRRGV